MFSIPKLKAINKTVCYFLVQIISLRLLNNQLKVRKTSMIFAQNNSINQSFLSENSTTYLTLQTACLKLKAGPNLAHFSSSTKFSPLRRGRAEFGQREFALGRRIQKQTLHLKKDCVQSANIYATNSTYLYQTATQYSYFFFQQYFF